MNRPGLLRDDGGAPGSGFEIHAPASGAIGLHSSLQVDECEGKLFVAVLEVDAAAVNFNAAKAERRGRKRRTDGHRRCRVSAWLRKPLCEIPVASHIAHQIQAGAAQRKRAEFDAAPQQAGPAEANGHRVGAEEIFLAEAGIFLNDDRICLEGKAIPQAESVTAYVDRTSKRGLQVRGENLADAGMLNGQR